MTTKNRGLTVPLLEEDEDNVDNGVEMTQFDAVDALPSDEQAYTPPVLAAESKADQVVVHHRGPLDELLDKLDQQGPEFYSHSFDETQPAAPDAKTLAQTALVEAINYAQRPMEFNGQINRAQYLLAATYRLVDTVAVSLVLLPSHEAYSLLARFSSVPILDLVLHRYIHPAATQVNPSYPTKKEVLGRLALAAVVGGVVEVVGTVAGTPEAYADFLAKPVGDNETANAVTEGLMAFGAVTTAERAAQRRIFPELSVTRAHAHALSYKQHAAHRTTKYVLNFAQTEGLFYFGVISFHPMAIVGAEVVRELVMFLTMPEPFVRLLKDEKEGEQKEENDLELMQIKDANLQLKAAGFNFSDDELENGKSSPTHAAQDAPRQESFAAKMKKILRRSRVVAMTAAVTTSYVVTEFVCAVAVGDCRDTSKVAGRAVKSAVALATYFVAEHFSARLFKRCYAKPTTAASTPASPANSPTPKN